MLDLKFVRANPDQVKENIKKKFQDHKLPLVDQVIAYDQEYRDLKTKGDDLRAVRNKKSKEIGKFMAQGDKDQAEKVKAEVVQVNQELEEDQARTLELEEKIKEIMMQIPQIIDPSVPIGKDDSENLEI